MVCFNQPSLQLGFGPFGDVILIRIMVSKVLLSALVFSACGTLRVRAIVWQPVLGHTQVPIWPEAIPDADEQPVSGPEYYTNVTSPVGVQWSAECNVSIPTLPVYS